MPSGGARLLALLGAAATIAAAMPAEPARAGSSDVAALQVAMGGLGLYPLHAVDGISGPWTVSAVRRFQRDRGLTVDGIAGSRTRAALGRRGRPNLGKRPLRNGKSGWDVAALQFLLHERGFGPGGFDGGFGPNTARAVRSFQAAAGLAVDGIAGPSTVRALRGGVLIAEPPSDPVRFFTPVNAPRGDGFGFVGGRRHTGVDFPAGYGAPVGAGGRGVVSFAGWNSGGYGNLIVISHRLGFESWYAHLDSIVVSPGQSVVGGTRIGYVGSTGRSTGPHLHFEVRRFGTPVDPAPRLLSAVAAGTPRAAPAPGPSAHTAHTGKRKRMRCRANGDARRGRDADPLRARFGRCP